MLLPLKKYTAGNGKAPRRASSLGLVEPAQDHGTAVARFRCIVDDSYLRVPRPGHDGGRPAP
jgi:hypothetical protein